MARDQGSEIWIRHNSDDTVVWLKLDRGWFGWQVVGRALYMARYKHDRHLERDTLERLGFERV